MTMTERAMLISLVEYIENAMWNMENSCAVLRGDLAKLETIIKNVKVES